MVRQPLVLSPDEEFASEARICGRYARDMFLDGEWSRGRADESIYRDAHRMAEVYELDPVRFIEIASAVFEGRA